MIWDKQKKMPDEKLSSFRPRHEMKFVIPDQIVGDVQDYVSTFCRPDPMGAGFPAQYKVTTLQLDSPDLSLHRAKSLEQLNRFKLRIRSYGEQEGDAPVFVEIKRKYDQIVCKSRAKLAAESYVDDLVLSLESDQLSGRGSEGSSVVWIEFVRLSKAIGAVPVMRVRYDRECWVGESDPGARVTFDRNLEYQSASNYLVFDNSSYWRTVPIGRNERQGQNVILELKSGLEVPRWMLEIVRHFGLRRTGYCKYSEAVLLESKFCGRDTFSQSGFRSRAS